MVIRDGYNSLAWETPSSWPRGSAKISRWQDSCSWHFFRLPSLSGQFLGNTFPQISSFKMAQVPKLSLLYLAIFFSRERQVVSWAPCHPVSKYLLSGKQTKHKCVADKISIVNVRVVTNYHDSILKLPMDSQSQHSDSHHSCLLVLLFAPSVKLKRFMASGWDHQLQSQNWAEILTLLLQGPHRDWTMLGRVMAPPLRSGYTWVPTVRKYPDLLGKMESNLRTLNLGIDPESSVGTKVFVMVLKNVEGGLAGQRHRSEVEDRE